MSKNLYCHMIVPGQQDKEICLVQTPSNEIDSMMGRYLREGKNLVWHSYTWRGIASMYLIWIDRIWGKKGLYPDHKQVKRERKKIGQAWKLAEDSGGYLKFSAW